MSTTKPPIVPGDFVVNRYFGVHKVVSTSEHYQKNDREVIWGHKKFGDKRDWPITTVVRIMDESYDKPRSRMSNTVNLKYSTKVNDAWIDALEVEYAKRIIRLRELMTGKCDVANSVKIP